MAYIKRLFNILSNLKFAIGLLFIIAFASGIGTSLPQGEFPETYIDQYSTKHYLGLFSGEFIIKLSLDHIYSSLWFISLLSTLGVSLILCTFRRQLPSLQSAIKWTYYKNVSQIKTLAISKTFQINSSPIDLKAFSIKLKQEGWEVREANNNISARKGLIGRLGPPLVHLGLILLMIGSTFGALNGSKLEKFLAQGSSINLLSPDQKNELNISLNKFDIERQPNGFTEQFRSLIELKDSSNDFTKEISVNHPLRYRGITIYQADWKLSAITMKFGDSPKLQLPLTQIPELGEQVWGIKIPNIKLIKEPLLLTLTSEQGPVRIYDDKGNLIKNLRPGSGPKNIKGVNIEVLNIIPSSGILFKYDPGVPIVYSGFAITLLGGFLSILSTKKLWIISEPDKKLIHFGGLSNRNPEGLALELPTLYEKLSKNN